MRLITKNYMHNKMSRHYYVKYYTSDIGYMSVCPSTGQIQLIRLVPKYRGMGIGRQLISVAYHDFIKDGTATELWAVTMEDHPFWSKLPGMSWMDPAHSSVTGHGYSVSLNDQDFKRWINDTNCTL